MGNTVKKLKTTLSANNEEEVDQAEEEEPLQTRIDTAVYNFVSIFNKSFYKASTRFVPLDWSELPKNRLETKDPLTHFEYYRPHFIDKVQPGDFTFINGRFGLLESKSSSVRAHYILFMEERAPKRLENSEKVVHFRFKRKKIIPLRVKNFVPSYGENNPIRQTRHSDEKKLYMRNSKRYILVKQVGPEQTQCIKIIDMVLNKVLLSKVKLKFSRKVGKQKLKLDSKFWNFEDEFKFEYSDGECYLVNFR